MPYLAAYLVARSDSISNECAILTKYKKYIDGEGLNCLAMEKVYNLMIISRLCLHDNHGRIWHSSKLISMRRLGL